MRSSVPEPPATVRRQVQAEPYATQYPDQQQAGVSRPLTIDDVVTKTGITLAVLTAVAVVSYFLVAGNLGAGHAVLRWSARSAASRWC